MTIYFDIDFLEKIPALVCGRRTDGFVKDIQFFSDYKSEAMAMVRHLEVFTQVGYDWDKLIGLTGVLTSREINQMAADCKPLADRAEKLKADIATLWRESTTEPGATVGGAGVKPILGAEVPLPTVVSPTAGT